MSVKILIINEKYNLILLNIKRNVELPKTTFLLLIYQSTKPKIKTMNRELWQFLSLFKNQTVHNDMLYVAD